MCKNKVTVSINQRRTNALCDTGASVSCISSSFISKAFITAPAFVPHHVTYIVGVGGTQHTVNGAVKLIVSFGTVYFVQSFLVVLDHHSPFYHFGYQFDE